MFRIDHHIHTTRHSPDSVMEPSALVRRAREVGLDAVVITEHDQAWSKRELELLGRDARGLVVLAGVEVSAYEGHFLVYGLEHLDEVEPGIPLRQLLDTVKRHEGAVVAAHPFRWEQEFDAIVESHGAVFDAVEYVSNNVSHQTRTLTDGLLKRFPMATTGSSDAHHEETVGCYFTEFPARIGSIEDFVAALRAGKSRPGHRLGARLTSGPVVAAAARAATSA